MKTVIYVNFPHEYASYKEIDQLVKWMDKHQGIYTRFWVVPSHGGEVKYRLFWKEYNYSDFIEKLFKHFSENLSNDYNGLNAELCVNWNNGVGMVISMDTTFRSVSDKGINDENASK